MRFEDERYVRLYTRDTTTWLMLPWQSRAVAPLILRKVDRAGILDLGDDGIEGLAVHIGIPFDVVEPGVDGLVRRGVIELREGALVWPRFLEGQESKQSDAARKRASRETAMAKALLDTEPASVTKRDQKSRNVTDGHENGQNVTVGHTRSQPVTDGHSVLCCAEPNQETPKPPSGAPCVLVSDKPEPAPTLVPTRDHEPAEWRASQTTDDGLFGMLEAEYARGLRAGIGRPVTGCAGRRDVQALRAVCQAHAIGADSEPLRSQALLTWVFAAAQGFGSTMPGTLTPTIVAFKGWLDRGRKHFDSGPKRHPTETNAPAQPRAFAKTPPRPAPTGNASGILDLIEAEDADCGAAAGPRSDVRDRDAPDIDPDEIGTSRGNVDGIAKRVGSTR